MDGEGNEREMRGDIATILIFIIFIYLYVYIKIGH